MVDMVRNILNLCKEAQNTYIEVFIPLGFFFNHFQREESFFYICQIDLNPSYFPSSLNYCI